MENNNNKRNSVLKSLSATTAAALVFSGAYAMSTPASCEVVEAPAYTLDDFNKDVLDYMQKNPTVNEAAARTYIALMNQEKLLASNPELLYELTGIYVYEELTEEKFENLVTKFHFDLEEKGIKTNISDARKLLTVINIDRMALECPELIEKIILNQQPNAFILDAFNITSAIKNYNYDTYYNEGHSMDNLVRLSDYIFDKESKSMLSLIEGYADTMNDNKGNAEEQNKLAAALMNEIQHYNGRLFTMKSGVGFASTIAFDGMMNYISFDEDSKRLLSRENMSALMNHDTLELYLSNIFGLLRQCTETKVKTK